jgi:hypothetical protein
MSIEDELHGLPDLTIEIGLTIKASDLERFLKIVRKFSQTPIYIR